MSGRINPDDTRLAVDLVDDNEALALATQIAHQLNKTVIVTDESGREVCIVPPPTLHS